MSSTAVARLRELHAAAIVREQAWDSGPYGLDSMEFGLVMEEVAPALLDVVEAVEAVDWRWIESVLSDDRAREIREALDRLEAITDSAYSTPSD